MKSERKGARYSIQSGRPAQLSQVQPRPNTSIKQPKEPKK